ncbi:MAG: hypothetical protein HYV27_15260 [Candidatus Hydrogenedentes bacterium]|nr:hypothetical protein [Candidatus Hydrogenedentota bacterium]
MENDKIQITVTRVEGEAARTAGTIAVAGKTGEIIVYGDYSYTITPAWMGARALQYAQKSDLNRIVRAAAGAAREVQD